MPNIPPGDAGDLRRERPDPNLLPASPTGFPLGRVSMTQTKPICSWLRGLALIGVAVSVTVSSLEVSAGEAAGLRQTTTVRAIQRAEPAVVNIEGNKPSAGSRGSENQQVNGMGAGVIIDRRGYILTNQHVVQDVGRIEVTLSSGRQYIGRLIDRDAQTDLALVKIDTGRHLPVIDCGTSSDLMLGEPVIAIGNPYGYHHTVTQGIVSALKRDIPVNGVQEYPDLIQTDASINPGNSGGPLLNANGDMIGINAAVRIGAQGIGFAIPVDRAIQIAAQMIARHRARSGSASPTLRVTTKYRGGKSYVTVVGRSDGDLKSGDIINAIDSRPIKNQLDIELALLDRQSNSSVDIEVDRGGAAVTTALNFDGSRSSRVQLASTTPSASRALSEFGLKLEVAPASAVRTSKTNYNGGLRVVSIRENSPAHAAQVQPGDILVGLLDWQTPHWKDLSWIFNRPEFRKTSKTKFRIIRGKDEYEGVFER